MLQLDKTRIAIRERSFVDLLDLALRVIRAYPWPLALAFSAGIAPFMLLNAWLLNGLAELNFELGFPPAYLVLMTLLIAVEIPLATAPATLYLGKAVFTERPELRTIAREFYQSLPRLLLYQVLLRVAYLHWTYFNEIILLERDSARRRAPGEKSRGQVLHEGREHDPIGRGIIVLMVGALLFVAVWASIYFVRTLLLSQSDWEFDLPIYTFYFPLALWIVAAYLTVVRFLGYLDLRIRREGWEVELAMRAEQTRLTKQLK